VLHKRRLFFLLLIFVFSRCEKQNFYHDYLHFEQEANNIKVHQMHRLDSLLQLSGLSQAQKAAVLMRKGQLLSLKEEDNEAVKQFLSASKVFKNHRQSQLLSKVYWHLGTSYSFQGKKVKATDYLLEALRLNEKYKDPKLEANIYNALSHVYYQYQDYDKSIGYLQKAIDILKKQKDSVELSTSYNNIAVIYKNMGEYDKAKDYNLISLEYNIKLKDTFAIAKSYNNLGLINEELGNFIEANDYYKKAIYLNDKIGSANTSSIQNLGNLFAKQKKYEEAENQYLTALNINNKTGNLPKQKKIYDALLELSISTNQLNKALKWQQKRDSIELALHNIENQERLTWIEDQYKLKTKEKELENLKSINKRNYVILSIFLLLILLFALFWMQKNKNKSLQTEKKNIELQQKILRAQMNPHFIFNVLSAIQHSLLENQPVKSAKYLSKFAKLIRQNFDFIQQKNISLSEEIDSLKNYLNTQQFRFNDKFDYDFIVSGVQVENEKIPPLLLQPFVENSIEHGFKNFKKQGKIIIKIQKINDRLCFEISDNGQGFDYTAKKTKLHALDIFLNRLKIRGKNEEESFKVISNQNGTIIKFCLKND